MDDLNNLEELRAQLSALDSTLGNASDMAASFDGELRRMRASLSETGKDVQTLERGLSRGLRRAFDGVVFDGMKLGNALQGMARSMANTAYSAAVRPVSGHFSSMIAEAILPFAKGGAFSQGRVTPFASGGVVSSPTAFPMQNGVGLMGEAGPEAIMPLTRGADGRLGIRSEGGAGAVNVTFNINTPDVDGFRRSQSQIAAQMSRAISRGQRNR